MEDCEQNPSASGPRWLAAFVLVASAGAIAAVLLGLGTAVTSPHSSLALAQFYVAAAGLIPMAVGIIAAITKHRRLAATALTIALLTYATWIVLNDAAEHGWGEAMWITP
jgi:hypothetical protein